MGQKPKDKDTRACAKEEERLPEFFTDEELEKLRCWQVAALPSMEKQLSAELRPVATALNCGFLVWDWTAYNPDQEVVENLICPRTTRNGMCGGRDPRTWTVAHFRRALGRPKEEEGGHVYYSKFVMSGSPNVWFKPGAKFVQGNGYLTEDIRDRRVYLLARRLHDLWGRKKHTYCSESMVSYCHDAVQAKEMDWGRTFYHWWIRQVHDVVNPRKDVGKRHNHCVLSPRYLATCTWHTGGSALPL